jgi:FtsH-binding integral membrane protein
VPATGRFGLTGLGWIALLAPFGLVMLLSFGIQRMSLAAAQAVFWSYAALMGISLAPILLVYTGASVAQVFFITAATFGAMSLWGYTTRSDLTGFGSFLFMGLIGIIIASVVNIFVHSSVMSFVISVVGVLVFTGLTAYDTQWIKESYAASDDSALAGRKAIFGALKLYLDFVNLFLMLMRLLGNRR